MKSTRTILALTAVFGFAAVCTTGETYHFTAEEPGYWNDDENWYPPGGPPDGDDTAIIDEGNHCIVYGQNAYVEVIQVETDATLTLKDGYDLHLGNYSNPTTSTIQSGGKLCFEGPNSSSLYINKGDVTINGSGTITAETTAGYVAGYIMNC